ncbi:hypothetical protein D3C77_363580 [compost metagenome]
MMLFIFIDAVAQFFTGFEMRHELAVEADGLTGLGITPDPRGAVVQGEAAKATDLDAISGRQALGHLFKHSLDGQLDILG